MDKAYIVANEEQESEVLNKLYSQGKKWNQLDNYVIPRKQYYVSLPYVIYEYGYSNYLKFGRVPKIKYSTEIVFDGRKEKKMSEKYIVSQEFMNELKEWRDNHELQTTFISGSDLFHFPHKIVEWVKGTNTLFDNRNRLITILQWLNNKDVFEVEKPKKWVVRSKERDSDGAYQYVQVSVDASHIDVMYTINLATFFDTKEEAESWTNSHQEVVEVEE